MTFSASISDKRFWSSTWKAENGYPLRSVDRLRQNRSTNRVGLTRNSTDTPSSSCSRAFGQSALGSWHFTDLPFYRAKVRLRSNSKHHNLMFSAAGENREASSGSRLIRCSQARNWLHTRQDIAAGRQPPLDDFAASRLRLDNRGPSRIDEHRAFHS